MSKVRFIMTEHPAWRTSNRDRIRVFSMPDGQQWFVRVHGSESVVSPVGEATSVLRMDDFTEIPETLGDTAPELLAALSGITPTRRFRTANLWEAIGTAIIRQVIRAPQARKLHRLFCETYGERVALPGGRSYALFPSPARTLGLADSAFADLGMAFKRRPLKQAAAAYLDQGDQWYKLSAAELLVTLPKVKGIGPWTAGAAAADFTNDWSVYPYADLAVRTWARKAAPCAEWPLDESEFGKTWDWLCGPHLSSMTLLTLAWGSQYGDVIQGTRVGRSL